MPNTADQLKVGKRPQKESLPFQIVFNVGIERHAVNQRQDLVGPGNDLVVIPVLLQYVVIGCNTVGRWNGKVGDVLRGVNRTEKYVTGIVGVVGVEFSQNPPRSLKIGRRGT